MVGPVKKRIWEKPYSGIFNTFCPTKNVFSRNRCRAKLKGLTENCFFAYFFRSFPIESYTQTASPVFVGQFQLSGGESNIFLYNCCWCIWQNLVLNLCSKTRDVLDKYVRVFKSKMKIARSWKIKCLCSLLGRVCLIYDSKGKNFFKIQHLGDWQISSKYLFSVYGTKQNILMFH